MAVISEKNQHLREEILRISGVNPGRCMRCGKCTGTCPAYDAMEYHPHEFVSMIDRGDLAPLLSSSSVYHCLSCMACAERCPRGVEPFRLVEAIRTVALRECGSSYLTPDDIPARIDADLPQQAIVSALRKYRK